MCVDQLARWHDRRAPGVSKHEQLSFQLWDEWDSLRSSRRRWIRSDGRGIAWILMLLLVMLVSPTYAALVNFDNCLPAPTIASNPQKLQFVPLDVSVKFDLTNSLHNLNITVYGNVSGTVDQSSSYPSPDDPQWANQNATVGKIVDLDTANNRYSTLITTVDVVSFSPYSGPTRFCDSIIQGECPLGPVFYANASDLSSLRSFSVQHDMLSSYRFATLSSTLLIKSGDAAATELGCISVDVTPDLGSALKSALAYVPLVILILVGVATVTAAIYSPWGTTDPFHWTSNYGRDEDVLRLVTPGFGDCLQYMQFAVLTGALSLNYPGYYQPVVSQVAWSTLMFNQSFLSPGNERNPVKDGVYTVNGTYGLDALQQYVGMESARDIWPGMIIWLLVIVVAITLIIQLAFAFRWLHRELANIPEEDLRSKNMPFTVGNVIRIVCNYLFLPLISLSFFQLVIARESPAYSVALAVVVILIMIAFAIWVIRLIASTRPKSYLFDDLPTVLLYGPLYNTFCDDAAAFTVVSLFLSFARGVAIGALQPSGIAQIVLLAICEVVAILTLVAFRPFPSPTSMNLYHACFSIVRFLTILLSVVFVPSLGVSQAARGWIGYVILFLHAVVLVFGFFLNALQTLVEVIARLAGAGGYEGGVTRGGLVKVFGMRQLSRRMPRRSVGTRQSMGSEAAMLAHTDERLSSQFDGSRPRSLSGSSAMLLNRAAASEGRTSAFYESGSAHGGTHSRANSSGLFTPTTPGSNPTFQGAGYQTTGSNSPKSGPLFAMQAHDPYYRPPRPRNKRVDMSGGEKGRTGGRQRAGSDADDDIIEGPMSGRGTPVPAYIPAPKDDLDLDDPRQSRKDYAVREVDFYYRVRGPPLSQSGTRKLKTGPADPTGPVSSATGFFRSLFRGKTKESGKGFEVVRSARAPPPGLLPEGDDVHEPYRDEPDEQATAGHSRRVSGSDRSYPDTDSDDNNRTGEALISLPQVESGGAIELPSRIGSQHSSPSGAPQASRPSRRDSRSLALEDDTASHRSLPVVTKAVSEEAHYPAPQLHPSSSGTGRLPFSAASSPSRDRNFSIASTTASTSSSRQHGNGTERPSSMGYVAQHRTRDYIHEASPDEPSFTGSAAELVDEPHHPEGSH
ncbi:integral membrane protein [Aspergillus bombycis]|uniref:Integral membrane protein n=1 Tax=Aspergillus bombycis TaxID=109264 RepID=A0A1F7ZRK7_9EURO|nr:integral membrane protein [Aspergillus bombycis]OGM41725.1 integral membrane protein [Aspergillus bombycis]